MDGPDIKTTVATVQHRGLGNPREGVTAVPADRQSGEGKKLYPGDQLEPDIVHPEFIVHLNQVTEDHTVIVKGAGTPHIEHRLRRNAEHSSEGRGSPGRPTRSG